MIKEVLIVEGKMDVVAVNRSVDADCIITGGFTLNRRTLNDIKHAYERRGIIILTDPDSAGECIRKFLTARFPNAKHAFVPKLDAIANNDIGIEQASPEAIEFTMSDLIVNRLNGSTDASERRAKLGEILGLGFANAKNFLRRLNHYGVTRAEFETALKEIENDR